MGFDDSANVQSRIRSGFELVRADEYNEADYAIVQDGKYKGVIGQGGLVLARVPVEIAKQYAEYYSKQAQEQNEAFKRSKSCAANNANLLSFSELCYLIILLKMQGRTNVESEI